LGSITHSTYDYKERANRLSRSRVSALPRISIDSKRGGEMRLPEIPVLSGPNAFLGL